MSNVAEGGAACCGIRAIYKKNAAPRFGERPCNGTADHAGANDSNLVATVCRGISTVCHRQ
jgi:hypothetical protein